MPMSASHPWRNRPSTASTWSTWSASCPPPHAQAPKASAGNPGLAASWAEPWASSTLARGSAGAHDGYAYAHKHAENRAPRGRGLAVLPIPADVAHAGAAQERVRPRVARLPAVDRRSGHLALFHVRGALRARHPV